MIKDERIANFKYSVPKIYTIKQECTAIDSTTVILYLDYFLF